VAKHQHFVVIDKMPFFVKKSLRRVSFYNKIVNSHLGWMAAEVSSSMVENEVVDGMTLAWW
jgi:hypothetical protein